MPKKQPFGGNVVLGAKVRKGFQFYPFVSGRLGIRVGRYPVGNNSDADYAEKIIKQADDRVAQYRADMELVREERDKWQEESRGQRKAKQEWRGKHEEAVSRIHELELSNKDKDAKLAEAEWHRCETNGCASRIPPRKREAATKKE